MIYDTYWLTSTQHLFDKRIHIIYLMHVFDVYIYQVCTRFAYKLQCIRVVYGLKQLEGNISDKTKNAGDNNIWG